MRRAHDTYVEARTPTRPAGFTVALSFAACLLAVCVFHLSGAPSAVGLVLIAAATAVSSIDAALPAAAGAGLLGWLFLTGFVTNPLGELYLDASRDGWRLAASIAVALAAASASRGYRSGRPSPTEGGSEMVDLTWSRADSPTGFRGP